MGTPSRTRNRLNVFDPSQRGIVRDLDLALSDLEDRVATLASASGGSTGVSVTASRGVAALDGSAQWIVSGPLESGGGSIGKGFLVVMQSNGRVALASNASWYGDSLIGFSLGTDDGRRRCSFVAAGEADALYRSTAGQTKEDDDLQAYQSLYACSAAGVISARMPDGWPGNGHLYHVGWCVDSRRVGENSDLYFIKARIYPNLRRIRY